MSVNLLHESSNKTNDALSGFSLQKFPIQVAQGVAPGAFRFDSFDMPLTFASATAQGGYITYQDTSVTILGESGAQGKLEMSLPATDNAEGSIEAGAGTQHLCQIDASDAELVFVETMVEFSALADEAFFFGLADVGTAAANALVDNTGALKDANLIGFHFDTAAPTSLDCVHRSDGNAAQVNKAAAATLVADTAVKLAIRTDPVVNTLRYMINGEVVYTKKMDELTDFVASTDKLAPIVAFKNGAAAAKTMQLYYLGWGRAAR